MRFLLDSNIVSDLVRHPRGRIADRIAAVGEQQVCTSIIVAAELRYGALKYGELRTTLERGGPPIGANDMLIAAHAMGLGYTVVTDNEREFSRIEDLGVENWLRPT